TWSSLIFFLWSRRAPTSTLFPYTTLFRSEDQHVLDGLLAEVVIDPVDLVLGEGRRHHLVQRARRGEIAPERLLDDDAHPAAAALGRPVQPRLAQAANEGRVERGRSRAVEEPVAAGASLLLDLAQVVAQARIQIGVGGVARVVEEGLREAVPHPLRRRLDAGELGDSLAHAGAELLVG